MKSIKLTKLERKEMNSITGGAAEGRRCGCGCKYENQGGSSSPANFSANVANNLATDGNVTGLYIYDPESGKIWDITGKPRN